MIRVLLLAALALALPAQGAEPPTPSSAAARGPEFPRIASAGGVFVLPGDLQMPSTDEPQRVVLDATGDRRTADGINERLEIAARLVNLYALAGVPAEQVHVAVVVHGKATPLVLSDAAYRSRFGSDNPDAGLLAELRAAGVEIFVCGQALAHQKLGVDEVRPDVTIALSALTELVQLQSQGYRLIP